MECCWLRRFGELVVVIVIIISVELGLQGEVWLRLLSLDKNGLVIRSILSGARNLALLRQQVGQQIERYH